MPPNLTPYRTDVPFQPFDQAWLIYEDADLIIVNKPSGLLSVPGRKVHPQHNLIAQVQTYCPSALIVHRLDMDTSGLMVLAKHREAHRHLSMQFQNRLTQKQYQAICFGYPSQASGRIQAPMRCDWERRPLQIIDFRHGKSACTLWHAKPLPNGLSQMTLTPVTGRSHQLRLHMKLLGHPILGDNLYADAIRDRLAQRLLLHASELQFSHPVTGRPMHFQHSVDLTEFLNGTHYA